jgi:hypothetical protein
MNIKHIFISALDIDEQLPFAVNKKKYKSLQENFKDQEQASKKLNLFVSSLEKMFKEKIYYIGMDVIGEKSYERFMFNNSGFFEVMVEPPIAMNAHFPDQKRAKHFCNALKKTISKLLPPTPQRDMFIDSIEVNDEKDTSLTVEGWKKIKKIRN